MNDLDLRTALHRDADLVGEPSPDLLDQLVRRRQHQRRQRAGMLTSALAVVVIAAGIPIGTSLLARSDGGPATETTVNPTPSVPHSAAPEVTPTTAADPSISAESTTAAPSTQATPTSIVTSWVRQSVHDLSFVVPAADVTPRTFVPEGSDWEHYEWNNGFADTAPPVTILVASAPGARPEWMPAPGSLLPAEDPLFVEPRPITVPGVTTAVYWRNSALFESDRPTMQWVSVYLESATRSYGVVIIVPNDADGEQVAQKFVNSLELP
jgi:hypothetical protein